MYLMCRLQTARLGVHTRPAWIHTSRHAAEDGIGGGSGGSGDGEDDGGDEVDVGVLPMFSWYKAFFTGMGTSQQVICRMLFGAGGCWTSPAVFL
jgi:hypothetical protein